MTATTRVCYWGPTGERCGQPAPSAVLHDGTSWQVVPIQTIDQTPFCADHAARFATTRNTNAGTDA